MNLAAWVAGGAAGAALASAALAATPGDYASAPAAGAAHGVASPDRAWQNYALNCQGCHRADGAGDGHSAPALAGHVAIFTQLIGGREYLGRVPGVATSPLSDADLAELLNWVLWRFDPAEVPKGFRPYDAAELGDLRAHPLRTEALAARARLLAQAGR
jgi:mono/diheme cytochrome c family protein